MSGAERPVLEARGLSLWYGATQALRAVDLRVRPRRITALIGPSGCGKSTLLRVFNRMNDRVAGARVAGTVLLDGEDVYRLPVEALRRRVGMVFQRPNVFPLSVRDNVAYGPRVHGLRAGEIDDAVEGGLRAVGLWEELGGQPEGDARGLSAEQQQRLCIARAIAVTPQVLLMDEPCSALDAEGTARVEALMRELSARYTIVLVTHNMQQAVRVADETAFLLLGELLDHGPTAALFARPADPRTADYLRGRFG